MNEEDPSPWSDATLLCGICGVRPAVVTWPVGDPLPMCNADYLAYTQAQQTP